jgi:hypothetical protein
MSYFLGNDATSVNTFYFVGFSQPLLVCSHPEADVCIAIIVLTDVKPYKYKYMLCLISDHELAEMNFVLFSRVWECMKKGQ